ncbi:bifunctional pyruvate/2-ketobutyrate formate lyase [Salmonella enterica]|nr:bifunctional pyruvate/2-ketobutyrate formate lyase [Salmonella enterica]EFQ5691055.1 bifunctional pyruvate/2-ketobutyrate formate lyase [Salmonella enterica]EFS5943290.1 bifunctional pyruvate/2-ketobutyrate formate lyase [Salmonella enterica]
MKVNIDTSDMLYAEAWRDFKGTDWKEEINVRDFIQHNYTPYEGDESFLADATPATTALWEKVMAGIRIENATHAPVDFDTNIATTITAHDAGYIEKELEKIVGLQTDKPLKRALHPFGGVNMIKSSFHAYGREMDADFEYTFTDLRKTHNQGVFDVYSPDMLRCRKSGVLTGLPDGYGRGRIIGDYRRVALYGIRYLVRERELQFADLQSNLEQGQNLEATIRLREELAEHRRALLQMQEMAAKYGYDISRPARNAQEAVQWLYFAYLAAVKSQNGGAMSLGRTASFLDIYIERDFNAGLLTEQQAQELIDHFIMKIRMVRFLRTPEFDSLFSGDPIWATEVIGGMGLDGRTLVTKNSFRYLHTLHTMGPAPEPNLTILWSEALPVAFKKYAAQVSIVTSSLQYENDDLMRTDFNSDDYAIACCVSPMVIGKQMQFFGARANLAKTLLYAINGGVDEKLKIQVGPKTAPLMDEVLDYDAVMESLDHFMDWLAVQYISALNIIHYMHDKYSYEASLMALHDRDVYRTMACGIAGLSVAADSLSAIRYAQVKPIRDENGLAIDFAIEGEYPQYGNNDERVDSIACDLAKLPFTYAKDGISYTFSIVPAALGKEDAVRKTNLVGLLDGYFHHEAQVEGGQHLNVNVMNREMLLDAIEHPENYPNLTIRVSGYAVRFNALTREQQQDVISRTFTQAM